MEEARAPLHTRRAGEIRRARHERLARRGDGCGFEALITLKCKFCQNEFDKLADAHVIPKSFFKLTKGKGKHSILVGVDERELDRKHKQDRLSDKSILCQDYDGRRFGPYDKHGIEAVLDLLNTKQIYRDDFGNPCAYLANKADYAKFKLFLLSVLWRASVSSIEFYEHINLGNSHAERIKEMLKKQDPGKETDYPFICFYQTGHHYPSTVLPSFQQRIGDVNFYRLYLPSSLIFLIKVDSRPLPNCFLPTAAKPNSPIPFCLFPYLGSPEMTYIENAKILTKKHLGIPLRTRTIFRIEKPNSG